MCPIIPKALGGTDEPSNLVLLCSRCHLEAPEENDPEAMWKWIKLTKIVLYDLYWNERRLSAHLKKYAQTS